MAEAEWYVVHTYSGYENKVKADIEKTVENRGLFDQILEVSIPLEETTELKNGVLTQVTNKMFPGYVLVHMVMTDDTWYVIRNTRGVTGFVGPGSKPVPLTKEEIEALGIGEIESDTDKVKNNTDKIQIDFEVGDSVVVTEGVWADTVSVVKSINMAHQTVEISINTMGRETPVELQFTEVKKV